MNQWVFNEYEMNDEKSKLQIEKIHGWLTEAYWCKGIPMEVVRQSNANSLCVGIYNQDEQVGFARIITDYATFAWICDVIIDPEHRAKGLGKALVPFILKHPELQNLRRICLGTRDAHELYKKFGFKVSENPQNFMEIKNNNIYLR